MLSGPVRVAAFRVSVVFCCFAPQNNKGGLYVITTASFFSQLGKLAILKRLKK